MPQIDYAIGVDLGGTSIKMGIVSKKGKIVKKLSIDTHAKGGPKAVIKQMKKGIGQLMKNNRRDIQGIGIGAPGSVLWKKGTIEYPPNLPGWESVPLGKIIKKEFGIPTFIENDANAAAIGELIFGAGKKLDNFIMITLGTGVGGGLIINKKLFRGDAGAAGEIGHVTIDHRGRQCKCGSRGCVETYIGNNYLISSVKNVIRKNPDSKIWELTGGDLEKLSPKLVSEAACLGDEFAIETIKDAGAKLGYAIASSVNLLDIPNIIIGGGVAGFGEILFEAVENTVKERVLTPFRDRVKIKPAKLKTQSGIKGASALVFYRN